MMQQYNSNSPTGPGTAPSLLSLTPPAVDFETLNTEYRALWSGSEDVGPYLSLLPHASLKTCLQVSSRVVTQLKGAQPRPLFVGACLDLAARLGESVEHRPETQTLLEKALGDARQIKDRYLEMYALIQLADLHDQQGRSAQALELYEEGLGLFRRNFSEDSPKLLPLVAVKARLSQDIGLSADLEELRQQVKKLLRLHRDSIEACEAWSELRDAVELDGLQFAPPREQDGKVFVALEHLDARPGATAAPVLSRFLQAQHKLSFGHTAEAKGLLLTALLMLDDRRLQQRGDTGLLTRIVDELALVCLDRQELLEADVYSSYAAALLAGAQVDDKALQRSIFETRVRVLEASEETGEEWAILKGRLLKLDFPSDGNTASL